MNTWGWVLTLLGVSMMGSSGVWAMADPMQPQSLPTPVPVQPPVVEPLFLQGIERFQAKDYRGAIAAYDRALKLNPTYINAYIARAEARRLLGDTRGAILDSTKAIELNPQSVDAYLNRCAAHYQARNFPKAVADCSRAIQLDAQDADAYYNRALAQRELKATIEAMNDFQQAAELYQQQLENAVFLEKGDEPEPVSLPLPIPPLPDALTTPSGILKRSPLPASRSIFKTPRGRGIPGRREPAGSRSLN